MGSDDKAVITGFICRLCSRMNRFVVHIYGDEGMQMQLAQKINVYLPITVNPNDPLPKTVCISCIDSLEAQHELMEQFKWARSRFARVAKQGASEVCERNHSPRPPEGNSTEGTTHVLARSSITNESPVSSFDGSDNNNVSRPPVEATASLPTSQNPNSSVL